MPIPSTCWPGDDLDGYKEINPPQKLFQLYWDSEILDVAGVPDVRIIRVADYFDVRFRIELTGLAWECVAGDWYFDMRFDEQGGPADFKLSSLLPADVLVYKNWRGCDTTCVELTYRVPAGTIAASVYEVTSTFRLYCCGKPAAVVGFEPLEEWQWY